MFLSVYLLIYCICYDGLRLISVCFTFVWLVILVRLLVVCLVVFGGFD